MKRLLAILFISVLGYFGYHYYQSNIKVPSITTSSSSSGTDLLSINQTTGKLGSIASVLGASIENTFENGKDLLSDATSGKSEPIINQLVSKTSETLKDLPKKEAEKIKYEFCKDVVSEYENKSVQKETP